MQSNYLDLSIIWITRKSDVEDSYLRQYLDLLDGYDIEKIIVGHSNIVGGDFKYIPFFEHGLDEKGLICHKKNIGVMAASRGFCLILHADVRPDLAFIQNFTKISNEFKFEEVICPIGETESGQRALTWCLYAGRQKDINEECCPSTYISGGAIFGRRTTFLKYKWDQNLCHNQEEDWHYSNYLKAVGIKQKGTDKWKVIMKNSQ